VVNEKRVGRGGRSELEEGQVKPYYEQDGITIYHGDCREVLADVRADVLVSDPPYFLPAAHYSVRSGTSKSVGDLSILEHYFRGVFAEFAAALPATGSAYVFCDGQSYPIFHRAAYSVFKKLRPLVWDKQVCINGYSWRHQHELILFAEREDAPCVPTGEGDVLKCRAVPIDDRVHLAQKPLELLRRLIAKSGTGTVLDPFCGAGSTLMAASQLGRPAIGIEIEEKYCEMAARRLSQGEIFGAGGDVQEATPLTAATPDGQTESLFG
jgi:site-specific DNA-methyltransferase (adenine-specific)